MGFCGGAQILGLLEAKRPDATSPEDDRRLIDQVLRRTSGQPIRGFAPPIDVERAWPGDPHPPRAKIAVRPERPALRGPRRAAAAGRPRRRCPSRTPTPSGPTRFCPAGRSRASKCWPRARSARRTSSPPAPRDGVFPNPSGPGLVRHRAARRSARADGAWPVIGAQFHAEQRDFASPARATRPSRSPTRSCSSRRPTSRWSTRTCASRPEPPPEPDTLALQHGREAAQGSLREARHPPRQGRRLRRRRHPARQVRRARQVLGRARGAASASATSSSAGTSADVLYDNARVTGWHTGYPDTHARIDPSTFRVLPWEPDTAAFLLDFVQTRRRAAPGVPARPAQARHRARRSARLRAPSSAAEFEFFVFKETPASLHAKGFRDLEPLVARHVRLLVGARGAERGSLPRHPRRHGALRHPHRGPAHRDGPGVYEVAIRTTRRSARRTRPRSSRRR